MKTISNQLWRYNRYRYIMTYYKKPFLPPPLIILSHVVLGLNAVWQKRRRTSTHDRGSGLSECVCVCMGGVFVYCILQMLLQVPFKIFNWTRLACIKYISFPELYLAPDDLKKLLEFEERCVAGYFCDKHNSQHCSQLNRISFAADKCVDKSVEPSALTLHNSVIYLKHINVFWPKTFMRQRDEGPIEDSRTGVVTSGSESEQRAVGQWRVSLA